MVTGLRTLSCSNGGQILHKLLGRSNMPTRQQIISSRCFGERIAEYEHMHQAICLYAIW